MEKQTTLSPCLFPPFLNASASLSKTLKNGQNGIPASHKMTVMLESNRGVQNPPKSQKGSSIPAGESRKGIREKEALSWVLKHKEVLTDGQEEGSGVMKNNPMPSSRHLALGMINGSRAHSRAAVAGEG